MAFAIVWNPGAQQTFNHLMVAAQDALDRRQGEGKATKIEG
jgi:hypothetical protein